MTDADSTPRARSHHARIAVVTGASAGIGRHRPGDRLGLRRRRVRRGPAGSRSGRSRRGGSRRPGPRPAGPRHPDGCCRPCPGVRRRQSGRGRARRDRRLGQRRDDHRVRPVVAGRPGRLPPRGRGDLPRAGGGTLAALEHMRPRDRGNIVNIGAALAFIGIPLQSAYCASKFACRGFFESVRAELLHEGSHVRIVMVHLPAVNTPQFDWCPPPWTRIRSRFPRSTSPRRSPGTSSRRPWTDAGRRSSAPGTTSSSPRED